SISTFLKDKMDPAKYIEDLASEWKKLGEELSPTPEKIPMKILLKIFKADEVKTMGDLCKGIVAPFAYLSETAFWNSFWMDEEIGKHVSKITDRLDNLASSYLEESKYWIKIAEGSGSIEEIVEILLNEKKAIEELEKALNEHMPAILDKFKETAYQPLTIAKESVNRGDSREYSFELLRLPKFLDIQIGQTPNKEWWEFWLTEPTYEITLLVKKVVIEGSGFVEKEYVVRQVIGTKLTMSEYETTVSPLLAPPLPLKFKLKVNYKDLGLDNWITFWMDEGIKQADVGITLKYGPEEETYESIYAHQAKGLEAFWKNLKIYLGYCKSIRERYDQLKG
ncbi:MAG: hypothetical protein NC903_03665, partial [Candidatus Omnitrophica bacterium]|nr:hypothetical protein [Candidatus Omnitrophota bacterium]